MYSSERHEVLIDDTAYVFAWGSATSEIHFYVDAYKSPRHIELTPEETAIDEFDVDFDEPLPPIRLHRRVPSDAPLTVYRHAINFANKVVGKHRPPFFTYSAEGKARWSLYGKAAFRGGFLAIASCGRFAGLAVIRCALLREMRCGCSDLS